MFIKVPSTKREVIYLGLTLLKNMSILIDLQVKWAHCTNVFLWNLLYYILNV